MHEIDLRSDTVTLPTAEMRKAISEADLGDDVFSEDPTVIKLEAEAADLTGKETALLVPSGTMANLVSVLSHCARGQELILGDKAHTFLYEAGGISAFGGVHSRQLPNKDDGTIDIDLIRASIRGADDHFPETGLISLENTHNMCYGAPLSKAYVDEVAELAHGKNVSIHIDGARIFNASVVLETAVNELVENADSVSFCMSKGLSAPVGSLVCGSEDFIHKARRLRKGLGGGMRQAGIIAAAGLEALNGMVDRLKEDHTNAGKLAEGISEIPGLSIIMDNVHTNIVYFELDNDSINGSELVISMAERGVRFFDVSTGRFRMVTHFGITSEDIDQTLSHLKNVAAS